MPIIAKAGGGKFTPAPEGPQQAVCVDVVDLGLVKQAWQGVEKELPMVRVVWHSAEHDPITNAPYQIQQRYTLSLHEKANLRKALEAWRGRAFTESELEGFDLESLIGVNVFLSITHNVSKGNTYANVTSLMRLPKGMTVLPITEGYIRVAERAPEPEQGAAPHNDDDDIPF